MNISETTIEILVATFILIGTLLGLLSSFGLARLPDVYTRAHANAKSITLGILSILLGAFLYFWLSEGIISIRLILGIVFVFITSPVAGHLIGRAAYRSGVKMADISVVDEMKRDLEKHARAMGHQPSGKKRKNSDAESIPTTHE